MDFRDLPTLSPAQERELLKRMRAAQNMDAVSSLEGLGNGLPVIKQRGIHDLTSAKDFIRSSILKGYSTAKTQAPILQQKGINALAKTRKYHPALLKALGVGAGVGMSAAIATNTNDPFRD